MKAEYLNITQEYVHSILDYDPETGVFFWKARSWVGGSAERTARWNTRYASRLAGRISPVNGYVSIKIDAKSYAAHRLAWFYVYGEWPPQHTDHINRVKSDNRIANLRLATPRENARNTAKTVCDNPSYRGRFRVRARVEGVVKTIGYFGTQEKARAAYYDFVGK